VHVGKGAATAYACRHRPGVPQRRKGSPGCHRLAPVVAPARFRRGSWAKLAVGSVTIHLGSPPTCSAISFGENLTYSYVLSSTSSSDGKLHFLFDLGCDKKCDKKMRQKDLLVLQVGPWWLTSDLRTDPPPLLQFGATFHLTSPCPHDNRSRLHVMIASPSSSPTAS
jgi:hypothetical protein